MSDSRLFKILYYLLDKGNATAPELAAAFEVSSRTIYRDIEALSGAGIPIYTEPGRNGGISLLHDFILDRTILSEHERQELLVALQSISATGYPSAKEIQTKLSALFHTTSENWIEVDFSRWGNSACDNTKFEQLKTALLQHKEMEILYESTAGKQSRRIIQPLKLSYKSKDWYIKAYCLKRQDFRLFKLNRILELKLLTKTFIPRPYPEPQDSPQQFCQTIVLLFSKTIAYRVYDEFDSTQIKMQENGDLLASAEMPVDPWLIGYLLSFGTKVEIIEPKELREILAAQAKEIYEKYQCR